MGYNVNVLKKKENFINDEKIINDIKKASKNAGIVCNVINNGGCISIWLMDQTAYEFYEKCRENNVDTSDYVFVEDIDKGQEVTIWYDGLDGSTYFDDEEIKGIENIENYYEIFYFEMGGTYYEKIIFNFLYEFLRLNPNDYVYVDDDCYYVHSFELLKKIKNESKEEEWLEIDPRK